jgi:hypothetical protein
VRQATPRGNIYANDGSPIAAQEDAVAIGFIPATSIKIALTLFYTTMARLTIYQVDEIREMLERALPFDYVALRRGNQRRRGCQHGFDQHLTGVFSIITPRAFTSGAAWHPRRWVT